MADTYVDKKGYRRFSDSGKSVARWSASKRVGGKLHSNQRVHHINRNKLDNRTSNLYVFKSQKGHDSIHRKDKKKTGKW